MRSTLHGFASLRTPSGRARNRRGIALVAGLLSIAAAVAALASWLRGPGFEAPPIRCGMRSAVFEVQCVDRSPYLLVNDLPYPTDFDATDNPTQSLDGTWMMRLDPDEVGVEGGWADGPGAGPGWREVKVPSTWNAAESELRDYRGVVWYARRFTPEPRPGDREYFPRLGFDGVALRSEVWLNGQRVGEREGGYTPFYFDVGRSIRRSGENLLVLRVDNRLTETSLPPLLSDDYRPAWAEYGGIHRGVRLEWLPLQYVFKARARSERIAEDRVSLAVEVFSHHRGGGPPFGMDLIVLDPAGRTVAAAAASDPGSTAENRVERHEFAVELPDARPYDPADPALYLIGITLGRGEAKHRVALKVGLREVGVEEGGLHFNGERILLRGVGLVEDDPVTGATRSETLVRRDLGLVRELNANFVRLAHHPHSGGTLRRARDLGLLFSQEIPFHRVGSGLLTRQEDLSLSRFGLHQLANRELLARAQQQLFEMVERDANNPALILWGVGSESFDLGDAAGRVHGWLADSVRFLDATRPVTMAELTTSVEYLDRLRTGAEFMDVVSVNLADGADDAKLDSLERQFPGKPILVAELGAGTSPLSARERAEHLHASLDRLRARDRIAGTVVWVLADFLCPGCPDPDDVGGIVSRDRTPKEAYRLLQREYGGSERAERDAAEKGS